MSSKMVFSVKQLKRFTDPFVKIKGEERANPIKYRFYVQTNDLPRDLLDWMQTNPREQNTNTDVAKAIRASLLNANREFHLWNRGILLSADEVVFDTRTGIISITMTDPEIHGNIDGGHTLRIILDQREKLVACGEKLPESYVEMEVITGLNTPEDLAEARNTSVSVDTKSMEELRKSYELLKKIMKDDKIEGNPYFERIEFKQNQMQGTRNAIDIREIIAILNMFNQKLYPNTDPEDSSPIQSFTGKEVSLKRFLQMGQPSNTPDDTLQEIRNAEIRNMIPVIPAIFRLWDHIERNFTAATAILGKRYGAKTYANYSKGDPNGTYALFSNCELIYTIPKGILYPVVGAFRALIRIDKKGEYFWLKDPIAAWEDLKKTIASQVMDTSDLVKDNPALIGKTKTLWNSTFLTVSFYATK